MTLAEMADFVCGKARANDAASLAACKKYLRQRYEMIYNDQLWRGSLYMHTFELPALERDYVPNFTPIGQAGVYFFPTVVDRVLGLRQTSGEIGVVDELELYRGSLDEYDQDGEPVQFSVLSPALMWLPDPDLDSQPVRLSGGDTSQTATVRWVDGDGEEHTTEIETGADTVFGSEGDESGVQLVESVTAPVSDAGLFLEWNEDDSGNWLRMARKRPTETSMPIRQRIRVFPKPGDGAAIGAYQLRALVKRKVIPLEDDADTPVLRGVDNLLMSFAQADMLQRARRYGQAGVVQQEALALFEQFKRMEVAQQSHRQRIVPEVTEVSGESEWMPGKGFV